MSNMTPREIVQELDKHIIGQKDAKRSVAVALRNRWRRMQLDADLAKEVTPKNILMIGPTGVGKTEIARRLAVLADAPFIKIEATKFTEVGYVGKDVESIIRDLVESSMKRTRETAMKLVTKKAEAAAEERILDYLLPKRESPIPGEQVDDSKTRSKFLTKLRDGLLDDKKLPYTAQNTIRIGGSFSNDKFVISPRLTYRTASYSILEDDNGNLIKNNAFALLNIHAGYHILNTEKNKLTFFVDVNNALNTKYYAVSSIGVDGFPLAPQDPLRARVGLDFNF